MVTLSYDPEFVPTEVRVDDDSLRVTFSSGLQVATPVSRFPRLERATPEQRKVWRLIGKGDGIHWPEVDEDISVKGLFSGHLGSISHPVEEIPKLIGELYKTTRRLNELFRGRPFTPDGHLVGSIGEVVAEYIYELKLERCSTPQVDAHTADERTVQIKLTGEHGKSYGVRWSSRTQLETPDLLLCLKLTREGFAEVYNGPFPLDLLQGRADQKNGQVALTVKRLAERNPSLLPKTHSFASINRWFSPQLTDVA